MNWSILSTVFEAIGILISCLVGVIAEPPPIPSNAAHLTPWTKSNFLAATFTQRMV